MAVQWRTETSMGNLTECYDLHVRSAVEDRRLALGFGRDQIFFNTDLVGQASTTYNASVRSGFRSVWLFTTVSDGSSCGFVRYNRTLLVVLVLYRKCKRTATRLAVFLFSGQVLAVSSGMPTRGRVLGVVRQVSPAIGVRWPWLLRCFPNLKFSGCLALGGEFCAVTLWTFPFRRSSPTEE